VLCVTFIVSGRYNNYVVLLKLAVLLSIVLTFAFVKKYFNYKKAEHFLILDSKTLTVPMPTMRNRTIDLSKIKSFETFHNSKKTTGLLIGLSDGSSTIISASAFESQALFDDFTKRLTGLTTLESTSASNNNTEAPRIQGFRKNSLAALAVAAIILATYAITKASGSSNITAEAAGIGALTKSSSQFRDFYRIGSSFFLHANFNHFFLNVMSLILIGGNIDTILGKFRFTSVLFGSALAGSLFSLIFSEHQFVIGASGGIMGLIGAYSVICLKYQHCIVGSVSSPAKNIIAILLLQIVFDLTNKGVDSFTHAGGFLFGAIYAFFLLKGPQPNRFSAPSSLETIGAALVASLYLIALTYFLFIYLTQTSSP
jgi:membrane associated rhomboid family serine protease